MSKPKHHDPHHLCRFRETELKTQIGIQADRIAELERRIRALHHSTGYTIEHYVGPKFSVCYTDGAPMSKDRIFFVLRLDGDDDFECRVARDVLFHYADRLQGTPEGDAALAALNQAHGVEP